VDDRPTSPSYKKTDILIGSGRTPSLIVVPPGVYHGWMSLEPDTLMCSVASHEYRRGSPDEVRVAADQFDELFGGSPWRIVPR
jgi:dTDP-4-dehydrorhamnose 3,5-epimerase-like enzyme